MTATYVGARTITIKKACCGKGGSNTGLKRDFTVEFPSRRRVRFLIGKPEPISQGEKEFLQALNSHQGREVFIFGGA